MPSAIDELIKRRVIQPWFNGTPRDQIAADNNIGAGTVSGIINNYKTQLEDSDFDSIRGLATEIRKQGLTFADLSSLLRLFNFFRESNVGQDQIEAFIERVHSGGTNFTKLRIEPTSKLKIEYEGLKLLQVVNVDDENNLHPPVFNAIF